MRSSDNTSMSINKPQPRLKTAGQTVKLELLLTVDRYVTASVSFGYRIRTC